MSPVGGAAVQLAATGPGGGGAASTVQTDTSGQFAFTGLSSGDWMIAPQKIGDAGQAIDADDALYALQATVGALTLSPMQTMACDVNGDGVVNAIDAIYILQYVVDMIPSFPVAQSCGSDWGFMPEPDATVNQQVVPPNTSGTTCQDGAIAFTPLATAATNQNFAAVLFGDCTGNWTSSGSALQALLSVPAAATPAVRLGRVQRHGRRLRIPVVVTPTATYHTVTLAVQYDAAQLAAPRVRRVSGSRQALLAVNKRQPGTLRISMASIDALAPGRVLVLEFTQTSAQLDGAPLSILRAAIGNE